MSTGAVGNDQFRTNPDLVKGIIKTPVGAEIDFTPFILPANELVTELCTTAPYAPRVAYTPARLEIIERYLSAHFYTVYERRSKQEMINSKSQAIYEGQTDMVLQSSHYGQSACMLDTNGRLAEHSRRAKQGVRGLLVSLGRNYNRRREGWEWGLFGCNDL